MQSFIERTQSIAKADWWPTAVERLMNHMDQDGGHDLAHLERVLINASNIANGEWDHGFPTDWETIAAAVLFHDAVNLKKNHPERHLASTKSAELAVQELKGLIDDGKLDEVFGAIRDHSYSSGFTPQTLAAKIVCDADRLEAIGALGIARTFYVSGMLNRSIVSMDDPFAQDGRELDDAEYGVDHFYKKLLHVKDTMHTITGKEIAAQRHEYLVGFLEQLANEINYT